MALNDILTSMDGARDALVTAINAKGGSLADNATLYQCADAVSNISTGTDTQEPVLLSPTNVTEETLALNTATNSYGTWNFSASNKASGYEPSALFMESYDNFTFGVESTHWLLVECTNTFAPESLYFYAGGSNVLGYTPKTLEIYGISNGADYLLGTATLVSTDKDKNGLSNTVEATIELNHGGRTYNSIKILQTSNQTGTSVQAIWRKIEIRGYDHDVAAPCSAEYYKCASVDTEAKTWSGYKAVFDSTAGTWSFESDVTAGLAYNFMTPSVGGVYDADCTMTASLDTGEISLLTPHIMTDASDGEWTVTASAQESDHNRAAWKVFDGRFGENYGWSGYPNTTGWLMVEHTTPFTVKRLKLSSGSMYYGYNGTLTISGSNTGNDFTDIWSGDNPINGSNYNTNDYQEIDLSTNTLPYKFLKLYWKGVSNRLYLGELEIWGR